MRKVAYISSSCGHCAKFMRDLSNYPELLRDFEMKDINKDPSAAIEARSFGGHGLPMVVFFPAGEEPIAVVGDRDALKAMIQVGQAGG